MRFCDKCGNLLVVDKGKTTLICRKCHRRVHLKREDIMISESMHEPKKEIIIMERDEGIAELPKTKIMCPKCDNMEAFWWMQQTRAADEPPTMFYRCTKCSYSWRSYG